MRGPNLSRQLGTLFAFAATAAITGIIGNSAYHHWKKAEPHLKPVLEMTIPFSIVVLFCGLGFLGAAFLIIKYNAALKVLSEVSNLKNSLIRLLPPICKAPEATLKSGMKERALDRILLSFIGLENFKLCGIAVYGPSSQGQHLVPWSVHGTPNENDPTLSFFIGDVLDPNQPSGGRGIAGTTFLDSRLRVVRLGRDGNADTNLYMPSPSEKVDYRCLICAAIPGIKGNQATLCLYSREVAQFDNEATQEIVEDFASNLSILLSA